MLLVRASSEWQKQAVRVRDTFYESPLCSEKGSEDVANSVQKGGANWLEDTMTLKACLLIG